MDSEEHNERNGTQLESLYSDLPALTLRRLSTGTMRTERNPVSYRAGVKSASANSDRQLRGRQQPTSLLLLKSQLVPVSLHTIPQLHPQLGLLLGRHGFPALLDAGEGGIRNGMIG